MTRRHAEGIIDLLKQFRQRKPDASISIELDRKVTDQLSKDDIIESEVVQAFRQVFAPEEVSYS